MKTRFTRLVSLVCILGMAAIPLRGQGDSSGGQYLIQPNDLLTVFVYNHPELSLDVTVQPDGRISTPLAQSIKAAGLNSDQLKQSLEKKLGEVIEVPNVNVIVKSIQSYRVFVIGKVKKEGVLSYEKPITVIQALTMAGGFADYAKTDRITIIRTIQGQAPNTQQEIRFRFNYDEATTGTSAQSQNRFLESGDVVVVN